MENAKLLVIKIRKFMRAFSDQTKLTLLITGLVGAGLVVDWASHLRGGAPSISDPRILTARRDLEKGAVLTQGDLSTVMGSEDDAKNNFTDQQLTLVLGSKTRFKLRRGEKLGFELLEPMGHHGITDRIPLGFRAYSFVPENDLPVRIGDRVDLIVSYSDEQKSTQRVASGVEIIDLKRSENGVTLVAAILEDDLPNLEKARQSGKIVITLRGSREKLSRKNSPEHSAKRQRNGLTQKIQILVEGDK